MGYEKDKLVELGTAALLHDVGMFRYLYLVNQPRKLTEKELNELKRHPREGSQDLEKVKNIIRQVIYATEQHHERIDGSGYPRKITGEFIHEYAKILGIVDVYEAMMHRRIYREQYSPLKTIQQIIACKKGFDYKITKILIEDIGIFPIGSYVELNTKEIGQVVRLNSKIPLRPVVDIITDSKGNRLRQKKRLDLKDESTICIRRELGKQEFKLPPP